MESKLLTSILEGPSSRIVCASNERLIRLGDLKRHVYHLQQAVSAQNRPVWVLYESQPYRFVVALLGLIGLGCKVRIPAKGQLDLARMNCDDLASIGEGEGTEYMPHVCIDDLESVAIPEVDQTRIATLDSQSSISFFTSGSTGSPKLIEKTVAQLMTEIRMFSSHWCISKNQLFIPLVAPQHIYGLGFAYLVPLVVGAPFYQYGASGLVGISEPVRIRGIAELAELHSMVVIGSPTIGRMAERILAVCDDCSVVSSNRHLPVSRVFSAGGELSDTDLNHFYELFGCDLTEIFGSTETGAVAFREHKVHRGKGDGEHYWHMLPGVQLCNQGVSGEESPSVRPLEVWGGHTGGTEHAPIATGDEIRLVENQQFQFVGRLDRIRKIEGKRISLDEIGAYVAKSDLVYEGYAIVLERNNRESIAVCLVLTHSGMALFRSRGKVGMDKAIRAHLANYFEPVTLPRYIRYVDRIPSTAQGKVRVEDVRDVFNIRISETSPIVLNTTIGETGFEMQIRIPIDLVFLEGHFNVFPVVPGLVLLKWAYEYIDSVLDIQAEPGRVSRLKFSKMIQPGHELTFAVEVGPSSMTFYYRDAKGEPLASGILYPWVKNLDKKT